MNSKTPHRRIPNPSIPETVGWMVKFSKAGATDLDVRRLVETICQGLEPGDYSSEILAIYYWVCKNIRYMRDIDNVEFLKTPKQLLSTPSGDCDDIACLLAAMLIACGNICRFAIVDISKGGANGKPMYSHVLCQVLIPSSSKWVTVDPVAGKESGQMHQRASAYKTFPFR